MGRAKIDLPIRPELKHVQVFPCTVIHGHQQAAIKFYTVDSFGHKTAFCMDEESLTNLLTNLIEMEIYRAELIELLKSVADVKEEE